MGYLRLVVQLHYAILCLIPPLQTTPAIVLQFVVTSDKLLDSAMPDVMLQRLHFLPVNGLAFAEEPHDIQILPVPSLTGAVARAPARPRQLLLGRRHSTLL